MPTLDIHTHHAAPQPEAVVALMVQSGEKLTPLIANQKYSIGIHPWHTMEEISEQQWRALEEIASLPEIVAIGETGIDLTPRGGPLFRQLLVFKRHIEISEQLGKPLIVHDVKAHDIIVGTRRDMKPARPWAIHGFRGKKGVADMLVRAGCYLSFGPNFNPESLRSVPQERILAETDDSDVAIEEVVNNLSQAYGKELTDIIAENTRRFLGA